MAYLRALVAGVFACFFGVAHAGYVQLAAPPGFSVSGGGFGYAASANDAVFGRVIHQPSGLTTTVAGQPVKMPASYRLAANAPRVAAQVLFLHPGVRTAVGIAAWLSGAALTYDLGSKVWAKIEKGVKVGDVLYAYNADGPWFTSAEAALAAYLETQAIYNFSFEAGSCEGSSCTYSRYSKSTGEFLGNHTLNLSTRKSGDETPDKYVPVTEQQFMDELAARPMPSTVPLELPKPTVLPVEQPFINPEPGANPAHRPMFVPMGNPVPNPNYDPNSPAIPANQPYFQPGVRIVPSPTPSNPWQVDMQPVDRPVGSADPNPDPQPDPEPGDGDKPRPEEQQSLCEKHPDIVACQRLGDVQPEALASKTVPVSIQKDDGFGPADGSCPAPKEFVILGKQMAFRWDLICDFASGIRPLLVGFAYLSAALAFLGLSRREV
ncbi:hypothetical protein Ajs_0721 [Acidovorax sp. JS42]|nr:hypothetical protein Ajs_0721 [Acidovorax sp. JS42]